jgi:hypothetical protein
MTSQTCLAVEKQPREEKAGRRLSRPLQALTDLSRKPLEVLLKLTTLKTRISILSDNANAVAKL